MAWIGLDDTDTLSGGCTTHEFHLLINELIKLSNTGAPWEVPTDFRLVRLWPFASKRTRGNAALATKIELEKEGEEALFQFLEEWFNKLCKKISKYEVVSSHHSKREQVPPEPCLLYSRIQFPDFYWSAVRGHIDLKYAKTMVSNNENVKIWSNSGKIEGLIGALAAVSWTGTNDHTWELIAYRKENNITSKRIISNDTVKEMVKKHTSTLLSRDPNSKKILIAPNTPCPVLYGIRSECPNDAELAHHHLQSYEENETCSTFQIWRTNQATGDHIESDYEGKLVSDAVRNRGGYTLIEVEAINPISERFTLIAFSESGPLNKLASKLKSGDLIGWQGLKSPSGEIHLERLKLIQGMPRDIKRPNCQCGSKLKSSGKSQPLRCEKCKINYPRLWEGEKITSGMWVEPYSSERRHLAKPLDRQ